MDTRRPVRPSSRRKSRGGYPLRPCDRRLVDAAVGMGDWLLGQPEITDSGRAAVEHLQAALRRLPDDTPSLCANYDFMACPTVRAEWRTMGDYPWTGIGRTWGVSMCRGRLEISSTFNTHSSAAPWDEDEHELWFGVHVGGHPHQGTWNFDRWIREVAGLDRWRGATGVTIEFEASCSWWDFSGENDSSKLDWQVEVPTPDIAAWATRPWGPDLEQAAHDRRHFSGDAGEYDSVSKVLDADGLPLPTVLVAESTRVAAPLTFIERSDPESAAVSAPSFLDIRRPLDLDFQPEEAEELGLGEPGAPLHSALAELRRRRYDGLTYLAARAAPETPRRLWIPFDTEQVVEGDVEQAARRLNQNVAPENWARLIRLCESKVWTRRTKAKRGQRPPRRQSLTRSARVSRLPGRTT